MVLGALVFGVVSLYRSRLFDVTRVEVVGNVGLSESQVTSIAAVPDDATLLRFPATAVAERLEAEPWIAEATVTRDFPHTMRIRVVERSGAALVDVGGAAFWVVDPDGVMIEQQTPETTTTLVVIRDVTGLDPQPGSKTLSEPLLNALAVWRGLSAELKERTRAMSAPSIDKTALITTDDITVFMGSAEETKRKDEVVRHILLEQAGKVVSINVRVVDRPTWRSIDDP